MRSIVDRMNLSYEAAYAIYSDYDKCLLFTLHRSILTLGKSQYYEYLLSYTANIESLQEHIKLSELGMVFVH